MIADWLIGKALEMKYDKHVTIRSLDDTLSIRARDAILQRI